MEQREGGYGWVVVAGGFVAHVVAFGLIYAFTVFFKPMLAEFGGSRGATSWIVSIANALMLGAGGVTGRLADRFGPRPVMLGGAALIGGGLVGSSYAGEIWHVYLAYGLALGTGVSASFIPAVGAVGQWFERRRGLAIGLAVAGSGVGSLVLAPLSERLIAGQGWRSAMRVLAFGSAAVLAAGAMVMRRRFTTQVPGGTFALVRRDRTFRLLYAGAFISSFGYLVPFVHMAPYATDLGHTAAAAAAIVAVTGIGNTVGRVLMGAVADRVGRLRIMQVSMVALTLAMAMWPLARGWFPLALFGGVYGLFAGSFIALFPALTGDYFGLERISGVTGLLFTGAAAGALFGAPVAGMLFDATGSYTSSILLSAATLGVGSLLLFPLPDPRARALALAEP